MIGVNSYSKQSLSGMCFHLNTDGDVQVVFGLFAAGGVLRDKTRKWILGIIIFWGSARYLLMSYGTYWTI